MKKIIGCFLISVFSFNSFSFGQTKIEKFCQVTVGFKNGMSTKTIATISFGIEDSLFRFKDSSIVMKLKKVDELKTAADVLNYMPLIGWSLVSINQGVNGEHLYFKRIFDTRDLVTSSP